MAAAAEEEDDEEAQAKKRKDKQTQRKENGQKSGQICDKIVPMRVALDTTEFDVPL